MSAVSGETKTFEVRGVIKEVRPAKKIAIIEHEEIPGYMKAMVMPLSVRESKELEGIATGDRILFRLNVTESEDWIDRIRVEGKTTPAPAAAAASLKQLEKGQALPEADLTDERGRPLRLSSYRGQALALTSDARRGVDGIAGVRF